MLVGKKLRILMIFGTRPELIKLYPLIKEFRQSGKIQLTVLSTNQQRDFLPDLYRFFKIYPEQELNFTPDKISPEGLVAKMLDLLCEKSFSNQDFDYVLVQGDTASALAGARYAEWINVPLIHLEAGLRTYDLKNPFPEEMFRTEISRLSKIHLCPTIRNAQYLEAESYRDNIYVVGNTAIDTLREYLPLVEKIDQNDRSEKKIFFSCHRRENFPDAIKAYLAELKTILENDTSIHLLISSPINREFRNLVNQWAKDLVGRITWKTPVNYLETLSLLSSCQLVLTDSGGMQEELSVIATPAIILRTKTERAEVSELDNIFFINQQSPFFIEQATLILGAEKEQAVFRQSSPFGDGMAAPRITSILQQYLPS